MHDFFALFPFFLALFFAKLRLFILIVKYLWINQQTLNNRNNAGDKKEKTFAGKLYLFSMNMND